MSQRQTTFQFIMQCTLNMAIKLYYYYYLCAKNIEMELLLISTECCCYYFITYHIDKLFPYVWEPSFDVHRNVDFTLVELLTFCRVTPNGVYDNLQKVNAHMKDAGDAGSTTINTTKHRETSLEYD